MRRSKARASSILVVFVGVDLDVDVDVDFSVGKDSPSSVTCEARLRLDGRAAAELADWYDLGWRALDQVGLDVLGPGAHPALARALRCQLPRVRGPGCRRPVRPRCVPGRSPPPGAVPLRRAVGRASTWYPVVLERVLRCACAALLGDHRSPEDGAAFVAQGVRPTALRAAALSASRTRHSQRQTTLSPRTCHRNWTGGDDSPHPVQLMRDSARRGRSRAGPARSTAAWASPSVWRSPGDSGSSMSRYGASSGGAGQTCLELVEDDGCSGPDGRR